MNFYKYAKTYCTGKPEFLEHKVRNRQAQFAPNSAQLLLFEELL